MKALRLVLAAWVVACEPRELDVSSMAATAADVDAGLPVGVTFLVAVVNPAVNTPHNTGVPGELGDGRDGIHIDPMPGGAAATVDGLALVEVPAASIDLFVGPAGLGLVVAASGEVIDAPIAFDGKAAAFFAATPIRYPLGDAVFFDPTVSSAELEKALAGDRAVVVLRPGVYVGDLVITGRDVLVFGLGWSERAVVIEGSVTAEGKGVRLRGVTITGNLSSQAKGFGISFSRVLGATNVTGAGGAFLRNVFCGTTVVPSKSVLLLDNFGVPPLASPPLGACDL